MRRVITLLAVAGLLAAGCGDDGDGSGGDASPDDDRLRLEVLSSRPEYVSGGDALVAVVAGEDGADLSEVRVEAGDRDVSDAFAPDPGDGGRAVGLVEDLEEGETRLTASLGDDRADLAVTNHPASGPVFAGEHLPLAACTTEVYGMDPSTPEDGCAAPVQVTWQYVDRDGDRHDLDDPTAPPGDVEMVELDGSEVPFVVRTETGVLNRAVYQISLLEPAADPSEALVPDTGAWNGRLVYRFGGGCGASFTQGYLGTGAPPLEVLRRGYATATATFNTFQVMCNDMLSAETASMVKEHFAETYGVPVHTIGEGGSGGAIQQILLAQNHPGLLDGIAPSVPFPDALSIAPGVFDCALLTNYYGSRHGRELSGEQQAAVNGHAVPGTCSLWDSTFANGLDPVAGCSFDVAGAFGAGDDDTPVPVVPPEDVYDAEDNPEGWRCTVWEANVAIAGRDPETGFARSGYDNQGVQYGLDALDEGAISVEEFLDLNERIGGFDMDGQPQPERSVVPDELVERAYATGRVSGPWGGLPDTPTILVDIYTDGIGDIHDRVRAFSLADRLAGEDGSWPASLSLWSVEAGADGSLLDTLTGAVGDDTAAATFALDEWLTGATEHQAEEGGSWQDALAAAKPESAESRCLLNEGDPVVGPDAPEDPACVDALPVHEEPRMAAGGPRSGDILKCQLVPVEDAADSYEVDLTGDQLDRLAEIFPDGVCDYDQPGVGQGPPDGTWLDLDDAG